MQAGINVRQLQVHLFPEFAGFDSATPTIEHISGQGVKLEAYSVSHGKASPWLPVLELLRRYFGIQNVDDPPSRQDKVRGRLAALDAALSEIAPYLMNLLGIQEGVAAAALRKVTLRTPERTWLG